MKDIYDNLQQNKISGEKKKVDYANDLVRFRTGVTPRAYKVKSNLETDVTPADFIKEDIICPVCQAKDNEEIHVKARKDS